MEKEKEVWGNGWLVRREARVLMMGSFTHKSDLSSLGDGILTPAIRPVCGRDILFFSCNLSLVSAIKHCPPHLEVLKGREPLSQCHMTGCCFVCHSLISLGRVLWTCPQPQLFIQSPVFFTVSGVFLWFTVQRIEPGPHSCYLGLQTPHLTLNLHILLCVCV